MSTLNGPEGWLGDIRVRSTFLEKCANNSESLARRFGPTFPMVPEGSLFDPLAAQGAPSRLFKIDLLVSAAELAFCTNETSRGKGLIQQAVELLREPSPELLLVARKAFYSALTTSTEIYVGDGNLRIDDFNRSWREFTSIVEMDANLPGLIFAALATGEPDSHARIVMTAYGADRVSYIARLSFLASSDSAILNLFGIFRVRGFMFFDPEELIHEYSPDSMETARASGIFAGQSALAMREYNYENRIALLQTNAIAWNSLAPANSLIDWILLMIHVALIRRDRTAHLKAIPIAGNATRFMRELAYELA